MSEDKIPLTEYESKSLDILTKIHYSLKFLIFASGALTGLLIAIGLALGSAQ